MNLRDYKWFHNPRGLHNKVIGQSLDMRRYLWPQLGWAKLIAVGDEYAKPRPETGISMAEEFIQNDAMPIIRMFRGEMGAMRIEDDPKRFEGLDWYGDIYPRYIAQGARWFEMYNEPNLAGEWPAGGWGMHISWDNRDLIEPMMDNWLDWAEKIIHMGGYPGFPALAESTGHKESAVYWINAFLGYLKERHESRFRWVIGNGLWCATHPYLANHFYQEPRGGPAYKARPIDQQNANESGWHFEYPYDPLQQRNDPGRTVFGGTDLTPRGDPNGLLAAGICFLQLLRKYFRAGPVPVVGTEGGVWRVPAPHDPPHIIDDRYPGYTWNSHADVTMAMWRWIAEQAPPWFFGLTCWDEPAWYDEHGDIPVVQRMIDEPPILKVVPDIKIRTGE